MARSPVSVPRWRKRTWVRLGWTVAVLIALVLTERWLAAPDSGCGPNADDYCAFGEGAADAATGALEAVAFLLWVIIWAVGLGLIRFVAWLPQALAHRRTLTELGRGPRRF
jgi:hypothetical protein